MYNAPLLSALEKYRRLNPARFHMPGHKGNCSPLSEIFGGALKFDVTELPETDNLFDDSGAILEAEQLAAELYGARETLFSAGGSTLCIQAMLRLACESGGKIICARNVHRAAVNAMALLNINPVWVFPRPFEGSSLPGAITPEDVENAARENSDAVAVFLTSPDYYGIISDIKGISNICGKYGLALLVDNAHGAHLNLAGKNLHPLANGADMTCDSAHKTLPALTGGAYMHINSPLFTKASAKSAMKLFGSTSPSYLIMLSLDLARAWAQSDGKAAFAQLSEKVGEIRGLCMDLGFFTPAEAVLDPCRIIIDTASAGIDGPRAALYFRKNGVSPEMSDMRHVVMIPSPFNTAGDFTRLSKTLKSLCAYRARPIPSKSFAPCLPKQAMPLGKAVLSRCETVPVSKCVGFAAAEAACPCPPCVPIVMPGELITRDIAFELKRYGVLSVKVVK